MHAIFCMVSAKLFGFSCYIAVTECLVCMVYGMVYLVY